jgi:hypothetical protein
MLYEFMTGAYVEVLVAKFRPEFILIVPPSGPMLSPGHRAEGNSPDLPQILNSNPILCPRSCRASVS